jgi:hypothetical protein
MELDMRVTSLASGRLVSQVNHAECLPLRYGITRGSRNGLIPAPLAACQLSYESSRKAFLQKQEEQPMSLGENAQMLCALRLLVINTVETKVGLAYSRHPSLTNTKKGGNSPHILRNITHQRT